MLKINNVIPLIEPHFHKDLSKTSYSVSRCKARSLLSHARFDIGFKLVYLEMLGKHTSLGEEIYKEHIRAFSLGAFTEPGNIKKNSIEIFFKTFNDTFDKIKTDGFDKSISLIPLSKNGHLANGSHRIASAAFLDKDVDCVDLQLQDSIYDYKFFYDRNVSDKDLDVAATKLVEYADNTHIAILWPTAIGFESKINDIIPNVIYRKNVHLNLNGAHNLISQIYYGESWIGSIENNFKGANGKLVECFRSANPVRVVAFHAESLEEVLAVKLRIRQLFNVGKHSIHITDTKEEAIRLARTMFNDNSVHFLNYAQPNKYTSTHFKLDEFKKYLIGNNTNIDDTVIDSGIVLSLLRFASSF
jgi:hypothetical protein